MTLELQRPQYEDLATEVENYDMGVEYDFHIEEDEDFQYVVLESEENIFDQSTILGDEIGAQSVSEILGENRYKLSVPK